MVMQVYGYSTDTVIANVSSDIRAEGGATEERISHGAGNPNHYRVDDKTGTEIPHPYLSFADVVMGDMSGALPMRQCTTPKIVSGKLAIDIDESEYEKRLT